MNSLAMWQGLVLALVGLVALVYVLEANSAISSERSGRYRLSEWEEER